MAAPQGTPSLEVKPDFADAQRRWLAFWEQEIIDRPCCVIRAPRPGAQHVGGPPYLAGAREDFGPIIEQILANGASTWYGGEAIQSAPQDNDDQASLSRQSREADLWRQERGCRNAAR